MPTRTMSTPARCSTTSARRRRGCTVDATDATKVSATLSPSPTTTTGKFPEYTKIWEDNTLNVVAIFGKFEDGATSGDAGIDGFNEFVGAMKTELGSHNLTTIPASVPTNPGVAAPDIEIDRDARRRQEDPRRRAAHRQRRRRACSNPRSARATKRCRRAPTSSSTTATPVSARTSARSPQRAKWVAGQYVVVFMNGCDTFAYIDGSLSASAQVAQRRRHHRLEVHRHRQQRHAGVLRVDGRRDR